MYTRLNGLHLLIHVNPWITTFLPSLEGWKAELADLADSFPTQWSPVNHRSDAGQEKLTDFLTTDFRHQHWSGRTAPHNSWNRTFEPLDWRTIRLSTCNSVEQLWYNLPVFPGRVVWELTDQSGSVFFFAVAWDVRELCWIVCSSSAAWFR